MRIRTGEESGALTWRSIAHARIEMHLRALAEEWGCTPTLAAIRVINVLYASNVQAAAHGAEVGVVRARASPPG